MNDTSKIIENLVNDRMNKYTLELSEHLLQTVQGVVKHEMAAKPDWFHGHEKDDDRRFDEILKSNGNQTKILTDIQTKVSNLDTMVFPLDSWYKTMTTEQKIRWAWVTSTSKIGGVILIIIALCGAVWAVFKFAIMNAINGH